MDFDKHCISIGSVCVKCNEPMPKEENAPRICSLEKDEDDKDE